MENEKSQLVFRRVNSYLSQLILALHSGNAGVRLYTRLFILFCRLETFHPYPVVSEITLGPWLVWLSGLSTSLRTKGSQVQFPVRAHTWVAGQVPSTGCARGNHTLMFLSLSFSFSSPSIKMNKYNL